MRAWRQAHQATLPYGAATGENHLSALMATPMPTYRAMHAPTVCRKRTANTEGEHHAGGRRRASISAPAPDGPGPACWRSVEGCSLVAVRTRGNSINKKQQLQLPPPTALTLRRPWVVLLFIGNPDTGGVGGAPMIIGCGAREKKHREHKVKSQREGEPSAVERAAPATPEGGGR